MRIRVSGELRLHSIKIALAGWSPMSDASRAPGHRFPRRLRSPTFKNGRSIAAYPLPLSVCDGTLRHSAVGTDVEEWKEYSAHAVDRYACWLRQ
jgi:hypothetical protein